MEADMPDRLRACAGLDRLYGVMDWIEGFCGRHPPANAHLLRLQTVTEELLANAASHGYGGEGEMPVWLELHPRKDGAALVFEDEAAEFDPSAVDAQPPDLGDDPSQAPVGGVGLVLVQGMTDRLRYSRNGRYNRLELVFGAGDLPDAVPSDGTESGSGGFRSPALGGGCP